MWPIIIFARQNFLCPNWRASAISIKFIKYWWDNFSLCLSPTLLFEWSQTICRYSNQFFWSSDFSGDEENSMSRRCATHNTHHACNCSSAVHLSNTKQNHEFRNWNKTNWRFIWRWWRVGACETESKIYSLNSLNFSSKFVRKICTRGRLYLAICHYLVFAFKIQTTLCRLLLTAFRMHFIWI